MAVYEEREKRYWFGPRAETARAAASLTGILLTAQLTVQYGLMDLIQHAPIAHGYNTDPQYGVHLVAAIAGSVVCWNLLKSMKQSAREYVRTQNVEQNLGRRLEGPDYLQLYPSIGQ